MRGRKVAVAGRNSRCLQRWTGGADLLHQSSESGITRSFEILHSDLALG